MTSFRYDMSQFYSLKATFEKILSRRTYLKIKETGTLADWKRETNKLLRAIALSVVATVKVADEKFFVEIEREIEYGKEIVACANDAAELFAALSATLTKLVFLQLGCIPSHNRAESVPLHERNWVLNRVRSVQYVQTTEQRAAIAGRGQGKGNVAP